MRPSRKLSSAALALAIAAAIRPAFADTTWQGTIGDWFNSANWTSGIPNNQTAADVNNGGTVQITSNNAAALYFSPGQGPGQAGSLILSGGTLSAQSEFIGDAGQGAIFQSGGVHKLSTLLFGHSLGSVGSYSLTNSGTLTASYQEFVGYNGFGSFNQTGGTHTIGSNISGVTSFFLGYAPGATGIYTLSGASALLIINGSAVVGGTDSTPGGAGILNINAGMVNISGALKIWNTSGTAVNLAGGVLSVDSLDTSGNPSRFLGDGVTAGWTGGTLAITGTSGLTIESGSTLGSNLTLNSSQVLSVAAQETIGNSTNGTFVQTGGTHMVGSNLYGQYLRLGFNPGVTGTYTMSGPSTLNVNADEQIGYLGSGSFLQENGNHQISGSLFVGYYPIASGAFNLSGGNLNVVGSEHLGFFGFGSFNQTGGSHTVSNSLYIGDGATGAYSLSGTGSLTVNGIEYLGYFGSGSLTQTGGTHTAGTTLSNQSLYLGYFSAARGEYNLKDNGNLVVYGQEIIGYSGAGYFSQSGGTHTAGYFLTGHDLYLGCNAGAFGNYDLSGSGTLTVIGQEIIGYSGTGVFTQSGGVHTLVYHDASHTNSDLTLGYNAAAVGSYSLSGAGVLSIPGVVLVGKYGTGAFNQTGGTNTATDITLGEQPGGSGYYILTGSGNIAVFSEWVGRGGAGMFEQTGGTNNPNNVTIGLSAGSSGAYLLNGSATLAASSSITVGNVGLGKFAQTGGNVTAGSLFIPGLNGTSAGVYTLGASGALMVSAGEFIGGKGFGTFNQTGGTHTVGTSLLPVTLFVGSTTGGLGVYILDGSNANLAVNGAVLMGGSNAGPRATGILNVNSGAMTVTNTLKIWNSLNTIVNLSGGLLSVGTLDTSGNPARFNWTGGTFAVTGSAGLALTPSGPLGSSVALSNNKTLQVSSLLTLASANSLAFSGNGNADLTTGDLLLHSSSPTLAADFATFRNYLLGGQINSSSASSATTLALAKGADFLALQPGSNFDGQPVTANDILIKYTYFGDADLDGNITINDYSILAASFLYGNFNPITNPASWVNGDFNDDGKVDMYDYALIDYALLNQSGTLANDLILQHAAEFGTPYIQSLESLTAPIPEPATALLLAASALALVPRRSRRSWR